MTQLKPKHCWFTLLALLLPAQALATPQSFRIEGTLYGTNGVPTPGPVNIVIDLYSVASGGSSIYSQAFNGTTLTNGRFSVVLNGAGLVGAVAGLAAGASLYGEVTVAGETIAPRIQARGAAFAVTAAAADAIAPGGTSGQLLTSQGAAAPAWTTVGTPANTPSTIVARDASGNFAAGNVTAQTVTLPNAPVNTTDGTNKAYVDAAGGGGGGGVCYYVTGGSCGVGFTLMSGSYAPYSGGSHNICCSNSITGGPAGTSGYIAFVTQFPLPGDMALGYPRTSGAQGVDEACQAAGGVGGYTKNMGVTWKALYSSSTLALSATQSWTSSRVFNVLGQELASLVNSYPWDGTASLYTANGTSYAGQYWTGSSDNGSIRTNFTCLNNWSEATSSYNGQYGQGLDFSAGSATCDATTQRLLCISNAAYALPLPTATTETAGHYAFFTLNGSNGNMGGLSGADAICQSAADGGLMSSPLGATWKALLSTSTVNAKDRVTWAGTLKNLYHQTVTNTPGTWAWTLTATNGLSNQNGGGFSNASFFTGSTSAGGWSGTSCTDWSTTAGNGTAGSALNSFNGQGNIGCTNSYQILCVTTAAL